ncbi:tripartite tricarboxylate transporter substrate binding protein [Oleispirillum naphthae]|uniref:tripartite tricarboxylate transporter substrate binding protein n=1 Tax=Oleispirillum naphthae TaxID=2838853 RepID=UPI0030824D3E
MSQPAQAEFPDRDVTMLIGYAAGGSTDIMARAMAPFIEKYLGGKATVVVKNVPGAGGQVAITQLAQADPDGYTIGNLNLPGTVARTYDRKAAYTIDSFTYLANIVDDTNIVVAKKGVYSSLKQVLDKAKKDPGGVTYGISGLGGDDHLAGLQLARAAGVTFTFIPFNSTAPCRAAVMGGHVDVAGINISEIHGYDNDLLVLGIMGEARSDLAPGRPTAREQGYDVEMSGTRGFVGPKGLPDAIRDKYIAAIKATYDDPAFQEIAKKQGLVLRILPGEKYKAFVKKQSDFIGEVWRTDPWKK